MFLTMEQWSMRGFRVYAGSKSVGRNGWGVPVFSRAQVWSPSRAFANRQPVIIYSPRRRYYYTY